MLTKTHSPAHAAAAMAAFVFAIVSGCGDESSRGSSNPNWLHSCDSDAVCGKGLSCLCGICTLECRTQANCATLGQSAMCLSNATLSSACMVNGLCLRFATLPDGSVTTGGSSGRGNGGRGTGGAGTGGRSNGGASTGGTGGASTGGSDAGGTGSGGKAATGGAPDASAGDLDAGPPPDSGRDASRAEGGTPSCEGKICRCASGAYCLSGAALCIEPHAPCPAEKRVVACVPSCEAGTVCVRRQTIGGALFTPDAGRCEDPRLIVPEAPFACSLPPSFACEPAPTACTGTATCACAGTLCTTGNECVDNVAGQIDCIARVP